MIYNIKDYIIKYDILCYIILYILLFNILQLHKVTLYSMLLNIKCTKWTHSLSVIACSGF